MNTKTYHGTIKTKLVDVKSNRHINYSKEIHDKDIKFKTGDIVRILKYKNVSTKRYVPNWSEEVFVITKVKCTVPCIYVMKVKKFLERFTQRNCKKTNQKEFRVENVI